MTEIGKFQSMKYGIKFPYGFSYAHLSEIQEVCLLSKKNFKLSTRFYDTLNHDLITLRNVKSYNKFDCVRLGLAIVSSYR